MINLSRFCVACRRLVPEDIGSPVLVIGPATVKWHKKHHKHVAKPDQEEFNCFCETCASKMLSLIQAQLEKGAKVL